MSKVKQTCQCWDVSIIHDNQESGKSGEPEGDAEAGSLLSQDHGVWPFPRSHITWYFRQKHTTICDPSFSENAEMAELYAEQRGTSPREAMFLVVRPVFADTREFNRY
jgi:hypothetical protein